MFKNKIKKEYKKNFNENFSVPFMLNEIKSGLKFNDTNKYNRKNPSYMIFEIIVYSSLLLAGVFSFANVFIILNKNHAYEFFWAASILTLTDLHIYFAMGIVAIVSLIILLVIKYARKKNK